jgi:hypothetical protein
MTVRQLKRGQNLKCSWCAENATHRGFVFAKSACPIHHQELVEWDRKAQAEDYSDAAFYGGF